jgi:hypothetical protein
MVIVFNKSLRMIIFSLSGDLALALLSGHPLLSFGSLTQLLDFGSHCYAPQSRSQPLRQLYLIKLLLARRVGIISNSERSQPEPCSTSISVHFLHTFLQYIVLNHILNTNRQLYKLCFSLLNSQKPSKTQCYKHLFHGNRAGNAL